VRAAWWFAIGYFATWLTFGLVRWRLYRGMERLTRQEIYLADRRRGQAALAYAVLRRVFLALEALSACAIDRIARRLGGNGGGHRKAAGCRVPVSKVDTMLSELSKKV